MNIFPGCATADPRFETIRSSPTIYRRTRLLLAQKTKQVDASLADHRRVHMRFRPTCSSWLDKVESWFAKIVERDAIARGVFTSVPDLNRKLMLRKRVKSLAASAGCSFNVQLRRAIACSPA